MHVVASMGRHAFKRQLMCAGCIAFTWFLFVRYEITAAAHIWVHCETAENGINNNYGDIVGIRFRASFWAGHRWFELPDRWISHPIKIKTEIGTSIRIDFTRIPTDCKQWFVAFIIVKQLIRFARHISNPIRTSGRWA